MSSKSVFESLQELFPQMDVRILRAISIEHAEDINEAVEFILSEVLPADSTKLDSSYILQISHDSKQQSRRVEGEKVAECVTAPDDEPLPPIGMVHHIGEAANRDLHSLFADGEREHFVLGQSQLMLQDASPISESSHEASDCNSKLSLNSGTEEESLFYESHNQSDHFELISNGGGENIFRTDQHAKFLVVPDSGNMALYANAEMFEVRDEKVTVEVDEQNISSAVYDKSKCQLEYGSNKEDDINIPLNGSDNDEFPGCSIISCRSLILHDLEAVADVPTSDPFMLSLPVGSNKDQIYQDSKPQVYKDAIDYENKKNASFDENSLELSSYDNEYYNILPTSLATRSGNSISTDLLEASINDAKNSKKKLLSSLDSLVGMMQEVELLEDTAKQAKEEASVAGRDILAKVEELKQIVKQSKDENNMHAGEVYGERSILATEARELESRLLRMSEERNKYIPVSEEIFEALEARLTAAREDINVADLEKLEKNKIAQNVLKEHELLRDAIMAESQKLQEEAEENSKLREFLMDRGRVVDALQGEIAVVCEDILSLKQRVVNRMPLPKSAQSSSWSSASSASSADKRVSSSFTNSPARKSSEKDLQLELTDSATLIDLKRKPCLDDWELFEDVTPF